MPSPTSQSMTSSRNNCPPMIPTLGDPMSLLDDISHPTSTKIRGHGGDDHLTLTLTPTTYNYLPTTATTRKKFKVWLEPRKQQQQYECTANTAQQQESSSFCSNERLARKLGKGLALKLATPMQYPLPGNNSENENENIFSTPRSRSSRSASETETSKRPFFPVLKFSPTANDSDKKPPRVPCLSLKPRIQPRSLRQRGTLYLEPILSMQDEPSTSFSFSICDMDTFTTATLRTP